MEIDNELLERIKDEVSAPKRRLQTINECLSNNNLWPEVCRRYSNEVNKSLYKEVMNQGDEIVLLGKILLKPSEKEAYETEISQLKKQLEEKEAMIPKSGYYSSQLDKIHSMQHEINDLKSKIEVKEKPDFEVMAENNNDLTSHAEIFAYEDGCKKIWNDYVIPRDATISDLQDQNKALAESYAKLQIRFGESESELNEAKELLKSNLPRLQAISNYEPAVKEIEEYLKDKR